MIAFVFGTTAEVIKAAPVLLSIEPTPLLIFTGQHNRGCDDLLERVGLHHPDARLVPPGSSDLASTSQAPGWAVRVARTALRDRPVLRRRLVADGRPPCILVQGDTLSTLAGTLIAKGIGAQVLHVEAGARSGDLRNPFPEEAVRKTVDRLADVMYAAGPGHAANLVRCSGDVVDTGVNTGFDALRLALALPAAQEPPEGEFGIVTLHRFELLRQPDLLRATVHTLLSARPPVDRLVMPTDAHSRHYLKEAGVLDELEASDQVVLCPKVDYPTFQHWLVRSRFVVTDSGGLSQECGYLGMPCLIHREAEEGVSGDRGSLLLSRFDMDVLRAFLDNPPPRDGVQLADIPSPSQIIARDLERRGLAIALPAPAWSQAQEA